MAVLYPDLVILQFPVWKPGQAHAAVANANGLLFVGHDFVGNVDETAFMCRRCHLAGRFNAVQSDDFSRLRELHQGAFHPASLKAA